MGLLKFIMLKFHITLEFSFSFKMHIELLCEHSSLLCVSATFLHSYWLIKMLVGLVPHSESGIVPRSSLLSAGQLGLWEFGKGGTVG